MIVLCRFLKKKKKHNSESQIRLSTLLKKPAVTFEKGPSLQNQISSLHMPVKHRGLS